jgi:5-methylcytosine-specific restriction endonuclease McrA
MDDRRGTAASRGYGHKWRKVRLDYLAQHPLCVMCERLGQVTAATVVDHKEPHRGDQKLFWSRSNWQALCKPHHDATKRAEEHRGHAIGVDLQGRPLDPGHPWSRAQA